MDWFRNMGNLSGKITMRCHINDLAPDLPSEHGREYRKRNGKLISYPPIYILGFPWALVVGKHIHNSQEFLSIKVHCGPGIPGQRISSCKARWKREASFIIKILSQNFNSQVAKCGTHAFICCDDECDFIDFILWEDLILERNGFCKDDVFLIEAHIKTDGSIDPDVGGIHNITTGNFLGVQNKTLILKPVILPNKIIEFRCLLKENEASFCTLLNKSWIGIFHSDGNDVKIVIHFNCNSLNSSTDYRRFIHGELTFVKNDTNGIMKSTEFKIAGIIHQMQNSQFVETLCSLREFEPFVTPEKLTINLTLTISEKNSTPNQPSTHKSVNINKENLGSLLLSNAANTGDLTLECEGVTLPCHKAVLMTASAVFGAIFLSMEDNHIVIVDMTLPGLRMFLRLIYKAASKTERIGAVVALDLMKAGEKYELKYIREFGTNALLLEQEQKFPIEMIFEMFAFCKQMGIQELMEKAVRVFKMKGNEFARTPEFAKILLEQTDIVQEIIALSLQF